MLGKVLSVVMGTGTANNPWKPKNQEQFDTIVADKDKVGNYIEYLGKTYRVEKEKLVGNFRVGQEITKLYFDTTKNPYKNFGDSDFDVTGLTLATDAYGREMSPAKVKYLAVTDETTTFTDALKKKFSLRKGLLIISVGNGQQYLYLSDDIIYMKALGVQQWVPFDNDDNSYPLDPPLVPTYVAPQMANNYWSTTDAGYVFTTLEPQFAQPYYPLKELSDAATRDDIKRGKKAYNSNGLILTGTHDEPENPWTPKTEAEYNALLTPEHVGNFFEYNGKITRFEGISYSGTFAVGDSITGVYFDTTKTPTIPDFTSDYETVDDIKVKYLFKTAAASEEDALSHYGLLWYEAVDGGDTIHILTYIAANGDSALVYTDVALGGDVPEPGWVTDGFTLSVAETITEVESNYDWNGVYAFKNKTANMVEYISAPILTNEGTAADLASGKQLINSQGEVVTGTATIATENKLAQYADGTLTEVTAEDLKGASNISPYAFAFCSSLTSVTIPDSVTSIGSGAFYICSELSSITIGSGVTSIGSGAFSGCDKLTTVYYTGDVAGWCQISGLENLMQNVTTLYINGQKVEGDLVIPDSVTNISDYAFNGCTGLTSITGSAANTSSVAKQAKPTSFVVTITSGTSIGNRAFYNCSGLTSITIPDSVTSIGEHVFDGCTGLTSVTIGNSVTSIGDYAFLYCSGLTNITIPGSVTRIGNKAFENCTGLTSVTIPDSVTSIGDGAFAYCSSLTSVTIHDSVTLIPPYVFQNCTGLTNVTIPNSVKTIETGAFSGCTGLTNITIPGSVTRIDNETFANCTGLTSITIPDSVTRIGERAFKNCTGLTSITIPDSVTEIGDGAFSGCTGLTSITGSATNTSSVAKQANHTSFVVIITGGTSIGYRAFENCTGLTSITIPDSVTSIGWSAFKGCAGLTSITIPSGVTSIGWSAFDGCTGLTNITIPGSVTSIDNETFANCAGLTSITIPDGVTSIGERAFKNCTGLTSITIPDSVTSISNATFDGCAGLTSVTIPNGVTSIGNYAFRNCTGLTNITIPGSVTSIGASAFYDCTGLTNVTIPNGVTSIGDYAFYNCSGLTSITIPSSVTSIGEGVFFGCTGLTSVTIPDSVTSIGDYAFRNCAGLTSITIPSSVTSIGSRSSDVFEGCYRLIEVYNKSTLLITAGSSSHGYVAYYAQNVYTNEGGSKLTTDENGYVIYTDGDEKILVAYHGTNTELILPSYITKINQYAFYNCNGLTSITIPDSVTSISNATFYGCAGLTSITIPNGVTSINNEAFRNCTGLTSITIPDSVTRIGASAFYGCTGLTSIAIPGNVTTIGNDAFSGCTGLTSITGSAESTSSVAKQANPTSFVVIITGGRNISNGAFLGCAGLTSVTIPNGMRNIYGSAFQNCSNLTSITLLPTTPPTLSDQVFSGISSSAVFTVPKGTLEAYKTATNWSAYADKMVEAAN